MGTTRALVRVVCALVVLAAFASAGGAATASAATDLTNPKHFFWAPGQSPQALPTPPRTT